MTDAIWGENQVSNQCTRNLAERFFGVLTLGRLEFFTVAFEALMSKKLSEYHKADPAYALTGFLNRRVQLKGKEGLLEVLARSPLENVSNRLVE